MDIFHTILERDPGCSENIQRDMPNFRVFKEFLFKKNLIIKTTLIKTKQFS